MVRNWSINGRFLAQPTSGVQRYAGEIVRSIDQLIADKHPLARDLNVRLLLPPDAAESPRLSAITPHIIGTISGHVWEQTFLPAASRAGLLSLCNSGPLALPKHIVCIHDLNTRIVPDSYSHGFRTLYRLLIPALGRTAARIATVSQFSASQLVEYGIAKKTKIDVIPNGHEHVLRWQPEHSQLTRAAAGLDTIVVIGNSAPHKNIGLLIRLADDLAKAGMRIAVAGASDARIFKSGATGTGPDNIVWLGRISDAQLAALLRDSLCLAFPSLTEGFGLPVLEAMVLGCPVVASDRASLPEVCGNASLYAAPSDPQGWLGHFSRLHRDAQLRAELAARGRTRASQFSWRISAELYLKAMARVDGLRVEEEMTTVVA